MHLAPWQSGLEDVDLTRSLIQDNMSAGYAFVLEGGEPEARRRWGKLVASGKLGVVRAPGKKPRLIGDGSVSGANRVSRVHEHVRLPGLQGIQRFLSMPAAQEKSWVAFSFDVAAAHKRVLTCEQEQGLCCFVKEFGMCTEGLLCCRAGMAFEGCSMVLTLFIACIAQVQLAANELGVGLSGSQFICVCVCVLFFFYFCCWDGIAKAPAGFAPVSFRWR